jgi:GNAT superfamily N-acetyltransferase
MATQAIPLPRPTLRDYRAVLATAYREDPVFVHPDEAFLARLLSGRSAYLNHAEARAFAVRGEAFAVAFLDPRLQEKHGFPIGAIGFLEAVSEEPARTVLDAAAGWLRDRGATRVWAPFNANPFYGVGLREDRLEERPFLGCSHHGPSLRSHLLAAGFVRRTGYLNFEIDLTSDGWREQRAEVPGISFRNASRRRFREEVATFIGLHNDAFRAVWGEAEVSREEAVQLMGRARLAVHPRLFQFAVADGRDVAMVLCMPDMNEILVPQRSPVTGPTGVWKMATRRRRVKTVGVLSVGVLPEHQGRGIGTALVSRACDAATALGYERMEYALVAEENEASKSTVARFGGKLCRRFGVYEKGLTDG